MGTRMAAAFFVLQLLSNRKSGKKISWIHSRKIGSSIIVKKLVADTFTLLIPFFSLSYSFTFRELLKHARLQRKEDK